MFTKFYRTVQKLGIQAFTEQSFGKFKKIFSVNSEHSEKMIESSTFYSENLCKFSINLFLKCLYPQLLNSFLNFIKLLFSVQSHFIFEIVRFIYKIFNLLIQEFLCVEMLKVNRFSRFVKDKNIVKACS